MSVFLYEVSLTSRFGKNIQYCIDLIPMNFSLSEFSLHIDD